MGEVRLSRIILCVQDVERLSEFHRQAFAFALVQHRIHASCRTREVS